MRLLLLLFLLSWPEGRTPIPGPAAPSQGTPPPGDIFKEFRYQGPRWAECDPSGASPRCKLPTLNKRTLNIDLKGATRAEMAIEFWGGHIGTRDQKFRANGNDWIPLPQPQNTPTRPECYFRTLLGNTTVPLPLGHLVEGENEFQFTCGPQICYGFEWGHYIIYSFTVRVYYDPSKPHPNGEVTSPQWGASIGDHPTFTATASSPNGSVKQVDFIAYYEDFNWDGDGVSRKWHYILQKGELARHVGRATAAPYRVTWDTTWVPDQDQPMKVRAKITNDQGLSYLTPPVEGLNFSRRRSVKMYKSSEVPERFWVRNGERKTCRLEVTDDPSRATAARLLLSSWSAQHPDEGEFATVGLNDKELGSRFGKKHDYSYDIFTVPLNAVRRGANTFYIQALPATHHHPAEVNWPGPVLFLEFGG